MKHGRDRYCAYCPIDESWRAASRKEWLSVPVADLYVASDYAWPSPPLDFWDPEAEPVSLAVEAGLIGGTVRRLVPKSERRQPITLDLDEPTIRPRSSRAKPYGKYGWCSIPILTAEHLLLPCHRHRGFGRAV